MDIEGFFVKAMQVLDGLREAVRKVSRKHWQKRERIAKWRGKREL